MKYEAVMEEVGGAVYMAEFTDSEEDARRIAAGWILAMKNVGWESVQSGGMWELKLSYMTVNVRICMKGVISGVVDLDDYLESYIPRSLWDNSGGTLGSLTDILDSWGYRVHTVYPKTDRTTFLVVAERDGKHYRVWGNGFVVLD
jgi:hypothetical protein